MVVSGVNTFDLIMLREKLPCHFHREPEVESNPNPNPVYTITTKQGPIYIITTK